jgi:hypothetical protein
MTTAVLRPATPTDPPVTPGTRRKRRWARAVIPFAVVLLLIVISVIAYLVQRVDVTDAAYASPTSDADIGGSRLAHLVAARGVPIETVTHTSDALVAANAGNVTVFVPAPSLVHPFYLRMLKLLPASTRVVLVAPGARELSGGHLPVGVSDQRLAAATVPPGCALPAAARAGPAAALRVRYTGVGGAYATELDRCYRSGLLHLRWYLTDLTLVGANEPFRNDRIGEDGNADLAVGLLTTSPKLIWLDLHEPEPRPGLITDPARTAGAGAPPSIGPGTPDPDFPIFGSAEPGETPLPGNANQDDGGSESNPLWGAFPQGVWAGLILLLIAAALLALAQGRRIGSPVAEPLPISVPAAETVHGRGRLYRRAKARDAALDTLRAAARDRLGRVLNLPADTPTDALAEAVAARTGRPAEEVRALLDGPVDDDDKPFVEVATALDNLPADVARAPAGPAPDEGVSL